MSRAEPVGAIAKSRDFINCVSRISSFLINSSFLVWFLQPVHCGSRGLMIYLIILRRTIFGRTPRDEWSARRRDLYLTTHETHNRQTSIPPGAIRTRNPSKPTGSDRRLRPRGHWDWLLNYYSRIFYNFKLRQSFKLAWSAWSLTFHALSCN